MKSTTRARLVFLLVSGAVTAGTPACSDDGGRHSLLSAGTGGAAGDGAASAPATDSGGRSTDGWTPVDDDAEDGGTSNGSIFDVGGDTGDGFAACVVGADIDGIGACGTPQLSASFQASVQWTFDGDGTAGSYVTPLVGNLTDDNGDGEVDLCDVPDVVVVARDHDTPAGGCYLALLSGDTGDEHWRFEHPVACRDNPALGDIDGDGLVEIVAVRLDAGDNYAYRMVSITNTGEQAWVSQPLSPHGGISHIGLADLDADGDVEIMVDGLIADHEGNEILTLNGITGSTGFAVDLDGDDDLEYVHSEGAHHHNGVPYFQHSELSYAFPHVADIDADGQPEIVYSSYPGLGLTVYEHDGTLKLEGRLPTLGGLPGALHDINGDGSVDITVGSGDMPGSYGVAEYLGGDLVPAWGVAVEGGCCAGSTAFDFLGDGRAEAVFADDFKLYIFGESGKVLTDAPRRSATGTDYPVVADVDNDGSAEIIIIASNPAETPAVQVISDQAEGWVQARRIWNQYGYHVTNVREDGTIPQFQPKNWQSLNTFRTQAQVGDGGVCFPAG